MTVTFQQPPSSRDFEVYQAVHAERLSTREAATRHGVSQTRVRQLVKRVAQWLSIVLPQADMAQENESRLAQHITADQRSAVAETLKSAGKNYVNVEFSEADHGFFCDARPSYNPVAAAQAWPLTLAFLNTYTAAQEQRASARS